MKADDIKQVAVIGAGTMGAGIAHVFAQTGYQVTLCDSSSESLERGMATIAKNLARMVKKERISEDDSKATLARLKSTTSLADCGKAQLAIEAISENLQAKTSIFTELSGLLAEEAILASNTSSLPITELAASSGRADRFVGMHFMNPVPLMKLVELIRGLATSDETFSAIEETCQRLGKTPVEVNDYPGFIANRLLMPMINEAVYALMEGAADEKAIDEIMKLGLNHPMGPLTLADFIGLDICLAIMETLHQGYGDSKYRPCPLLRKMVQAGFLGRKSGRGFYRYDE